MSNPWLRLYTEAVDDEKLRLLAFEDRWHFIAILCCKGKSIIDEDNKELMRRKVAVKLGLDPRTLDEVARRLAEVGLIDEQTLQPLAWEKRQFTSDNDATAKDRKRRQRERERQSQHPSQTVTHPSPVTVTNVTALEEEAEADAEAETETDSVSQKRTGFKKESASAAKAPPRTRNAKIPLPAEWLPDSSTYALLEKQGIARDFAESCLDEFRLYWQENGERRPGWEATFLNSVKRSWERHSTRKPHAPHDKHDRIAAKSHSALEQWITTDRDTQAIEGTCTHEIH